MFLLPEEGEVTPLGRWKQASHISSVSCSKSFHSPVKLDLDSILDLEVGIPCRPDALHTACVFLVAYLEDQFPPAEHDSQQCIGVLATDALN